MRAIFWFFCGKRCCGSFLISNTSNPTWLTYSGDRYSLIKSWTGQKVVGFNSQSKKAPKVTAFWPSSIWLPFPVRNIVKLAGWIIQQVTLLLFMSAEQPWKFLTLFSFWMKTLTKYGSGVAPWYVLPLLSNTGESEPMAWVTAWHHRLWKSNSTCD